MIVENRHPWWQQVSIHLHSPLPPQKVGDACFSIHSSTIKTFRKLSARAHVCQVGDAKEQKYTKIITLWRAGVYLTDPVPLI